MNLYLSQEYNLYQLMKERHRPFSEQEIRNLLTQVLQGLTHMHRNGYFHRDLKPGMMFSYAGFQHIISFTYVY